MLPPLQLCIQMSRSRAAFINKSTWLVMERLIYHSPSPAVPLNCSLPVADTNSTTPRITSVDNTKPILFPIHSTLARLPTWLDIFRIGAVQDVIRGGLMYFFLTVPPSKSMI